MGLVGHRLVVLCLRSDGHVMITSACVLHRTVNAGHKDRCRTFKFESLIERKKNKTTKMLLRIHEVQSRFLFQQMWLHQMTTEKEKPY